MPIKGTDKIKDFPEQFNKLERQVKLFSPYTLSNAFKLLALISIVAINWKITHWGVAVSSVLIIGTFIATEAFVFMLARTILDVRTDENIVKLFILLLFKDSEHASKILDAYVRKPDAGPNGEGSGQIRQ